MEPPLNLPLHGNKIDEFSVVYQFGDWTGKKLLNRKQSCKIFIKKLQISYNMLY